MSVRILVGDALASLKTLPDESVQCCVTSPPYWGLRDYGVASQLGLEKTPDEYVANMVAVFREVKRVLRRDGTLWLNIGDSYNAYNGNRGRSTSFQSATEDAMPRLPSGAGLTDPTLKPKDLVGIPWMLAFALRADGWYLRSDVIWSKPNPMPESVTDRPTKAHEYVFLLSKSASYFYDADAIAEEGSGRSSGMHAADKTGAGRGFEIRGGFAKVGDVEWHTRNKRSVWTIATQPFKESHFATMPPELAETCIKAGSAKQACEHCGAPWERVVEREPGFEARRVHDGGLRGRRTGAAQDANYRGVGCTRSETLGFAPSCSCENNTGSARSVVLDPFGGAGTTGLVADRLERDAILCELNPAYAEMARKRIQNDNPMFTEVNVA